jgi:hypothetical protein
VPTRDRRTVGELLADSDSLARETLLDLSADRSTASVRTWGQVVDAAARLQNKKARLDYYYGLFEDEFPDRATLITVFDATLTNLIELFPWPNGLRWSRKVDFYTLFVVLSERIKGGFDLDFTDRTKKALKSLAEDVSRILSLVNLGEEEGLRDEQIGAVLYARG